MILQAARHAFRFDGRNCSGFPPRFGMHQECGAAVQVSAHQVDAALGILPAADHHKLELLMQELFGSLLEGGLNFNKIGQHADWPEVASLAAFDGRKKSLDAFSGVRSM